jgi:hypothetical protein
LVDILPTGGVQPYEIQVGTNPFAPLSGPVTLVPGSNTVTLRDAAGTTVSQDITIPVALDLTIVEFVCNHDTNTFQARIQVTGGTAPYNSGNGTQVSDNVFLTSPISAGETLSFQVFDSKKCTSGIIVEHTCEEPCDLPCEGKSRKCAYRLWLQPPNKGTLYRAYNPLKEVSFRFNGQNFNLPQMMQATADELNANFESVMAKMVAILNKEIAKTLTGVFGDAGKNRLVLTYEPSKEDPFGILWIEYFVCETFSIEFEFNYAKPTPGFNLQFRYTNEPDGNMKPFNGTITTNVELNGKQTIVPAFDCRERNQCSGSDYVKLCTDPNLKPEFKIIPKDNNTFIFESTTPNDKLLAWVWDVLNTPANEPFYEGESVESIVSKPNGIVRLTVINESGCFAFTENKFLQ